MTFLAILASITLTCCTGYTYQQDNIVEESVELGLKAELGLDVDLSPSTPETGFSPKSIKPFTKDEPKK